MDAIDAGATAYLTKSATADLLANRTDKGTIASRLGIAPDTVEWHASHVIEKLGEHSKLQAVIVAARSGLIEL